MINSRKLLTQSSAYLILSALVLSPLYGSSAFAFSGGSILSNTSCSVCHNGGTATLLIAGPDTVAPHSVNTYTLSITDGPGVIGGLNVYAPEGGVLSTLDALTQLSSGEITQTEPKAFSGGTVSWNFQWQAPAVNGTVNIFAQGVSANDGQGAGGDWAGVTSFAIQVVPVPAAVFLFGSALGLLGWMRRRAA